MRRNRRHSRVLVLLAASCGLLAGCGEDGPTGPEAPGSLTELFGDVLLRADGSTVEAETLADEAVIGVLFASQGCPACSQFTPVLADTYRELKAEQKSFEVVLVSSESTQASLLAYMAGAGMPWLGVPPGPRVQALVNRYAVEWVPTLIVIDGTGRTLSLDGRGEVAQHGAAAYNGWLAGAGG